MSFIENNKLKIVIITVFTLIMSILTRIYIGLPIWSDIINNDRGIKELISFLLINWQFWVAFIVIGGLTGVFVFSEKTRNFVYRYRYAFAAFIFVFCVLFEISGSSMGQWCNDFGVEDKDIIAGMSRPVRSDEYGLTTPYLFSQIASRQEDAFEYFSDFANGIESDLFMGIRQPIKNILTILRPFVLGFLFLSPAKAFSFWWCGKLIALFMATFEMGMLLTGKKKSLSVIMAMLITFSSVVSWWFSTSVAEVIIYTEIAMLLFNKYLTEEKLYKRILLLIGILYQAGCFIMLLYPSWQVPFVYVILVLTAWIIMKNYKKITLKWYDYASVFAGLTGLALVFVYIFNKSADTVTLISQSVYPGERLELGGNGFSYMFTYHLNMWFSMTNFVLGTNVCEAATIFDMFPFSIVVPIVAMIMNKKKDLLSIMLLCLNLYFFVWIAFGFNEFFAKITFLSNSQAIRTMLAFGFVNVMLLIRGVALMKESMKPAKAAVLSGGISALIIIVSLLVTQNAEVGLAYKVVYFGAGFLLIGILAFGLFEYNKKNWTLMTAMLVGIISMICGTMVNPIRKGFDSVYEIEWIKEINQVAGECDEDAVWAVESSNISALSYANVGLMCGVKTFNSTAVYPNPELWSKIDPNGDNSDVYNRFSHIGIYIKESGEPEFILVTPDSFKVYLTFDDLHKAGVTFVTGYSDLEECAKNAKCTVTRVNNSDNVYIYMLE